MHAVSESKMGGAVDLQSVKATDWTEEKTNKFALHFFATLLIGTGITLIAISLAGLIPGSFVFLAIPLFALGGVAIYCELQIHDYNNPEALEKIKEKAQNMSFSKLEKLHGLDNINKYQIVSKSSLQEKFAEAMKEKTFSEIISLYSLEKIKEFSLMAEATLRAKLVRHIQNFSCASDFCKDCYLFNYLETWLNYAILTGDDFDKLNGVVVIFKNINNELSVNIHSINSSFSERTESLLANLKKEIAKQKQAHQKERDEKLKEIQDVKDKEIEKIKKDRAVLLSKEASAVKTAKEQAKSAVEQEFLSSETSASDRKKAVAQREEEAENQTRTRRAMALRTVFSIFDQNQSLIEDRFTLGESRIQRVYLEKTIKTREFGDAQRNEINSSSEASVQQANYNGAFQKVKEKAEADLKALDLVFDRIKQDLLQSIS